MSDTAATKHRQPRTLEQATAMLERFAVLDGDRAGIEAERNEQIAKINAAADEQLVPIVEEMVAIGEKIQPWWAKAAAELLPAKRKSMELGGCIIGSRTGKTVLAIAGAENALIEA
ncbi:MAG: host-nuclease inhibitor Gam family protein, partial [Blastomonas fulva]|uniref:host-nuclease inhibitor Gam family protein n=1 Tax=Blastomonas fulva TaxID=1550728 RepID=UPI0024E1A1A9